ncbi:hypothetical protein ACFLXQ_01445 [Chloroflexota bacterium]
MKQFLDSNGAIKIRQFTSENHNLLDGDIHPDTVADAVTKGSLIVGNSTPKWDEQGVGANGQVLTANSADANGLRWDDGIINRGWDVGTSTTITATATWTNINGMAVTSTIRYGTVYVLVTVHAYHLVVGTNWRIRVTMDGTGTTYGDPHIYDSNANSTVTGASMIARFTGVSAASHVFRVQAINNSGGTLKFADTSYRRCTMMVWEG